MLHFLSICEEIHEFCITRPILGPSGRDALGRRKTENGQKAAEMIVLNAGAALYAADHAYSLKEGVELAHDALHTGLAREKLEELGAFTAVFKMENEG